MHKKTGHCSLEARWGTPIHHRDNITQPQETLRGQSDHTLPTPTRRQIWGKRERQVLVFPGEIKSPAANLSLANGVDTTCLEMLSASNKLSLSLSLPLSIFSFTSVLWGRRGMRVVGQVSVKLIDCGCHLIELPCGRSFCSRSVPCPVGSVSAKLRPQADLSCAICGHTP